MYIYQQFGGEVSFVVLWGAIFFWELAFYMKLAYMLIQKKYAMHSIQTKVLGAHL